MKLWLRLEGIFLVVLALSIRDNLAAPRPFINLHVPLFTIDVGGISKLQYF